jgi:hypothetical protein
MFKSIYGYLWLFVENLTKKLSSQMEIIFLEMRALCCKMDFWVVRKNNFAETILRYTILDIFKMSLGDEIPYDPWGSTEWKMDVRPASPGRAKC